MTLHFAENIYVTDDLALTFYKNGVEVQEITYTVQGSGTHTLEIGWTGLAATDWLLGHYAPTSAATAIADLSGNWEADDDGYWVDGMSDDNTIDMSSFGTDIEGFDGLDIMGNGGNDTITGSAFDDWISGGPGADTMTGGPGRDQFEFESGDSPAVTSVDRLSSAGFNTGDIFHLDQGVDRITDFNFDDAIWIDLPSNQSATGYTEMSGMYGDGNFEVLPGIYNADTGEFRVDYNQNSTSDDKDTLLIYDGDPTVGSAEMTAVVLSGVLSYDLNTYNGSYITYYQEAI
jgi:hypothetical protein